MKKNKPDLLSNSKGLYNGNYGERNINLAHKHALSVSIGGGTFNRSSKEKDDLLSKSVGLDGLGSSYKFGSLKSTSKAEKLGAIKKSGPIKATIATDKSRMSKYEHLSSKFTENPPEKGTKKHKRRDKRPHSSTFIGNYKHEKELYSKIMGTHNKSKAKAIKTTSTGLKKKNTKRVRSASPGGLNNFILQKPGKYKEPQRAIGSGLYTTSGKVTSKYS